jgi:ATP adenylyltransferase/5',5'''-P-1,P-4-tetraphosphate phosphorylase II
MNVLEQTKLLLNEQTQTWELAFKNYQGLKNVKIKEFKLDGGSSIKVQFNPERITSSTAKVDAKSIQQRPCFLCNENRPKEQKGLEFNNDYLILVNPFPIFSKHLTIIHKKHTDQLIEKHFDTMLSLAKELSDFTIFYNGPKCGASAPDHFHFQAGIKDFLPIEDDYRSKDFIKLLTETVEIQLFTWINYNRQIITLESSSENGLGRIFQKLINLLKKEHLTGEPEPMLNILAYFENERYIVHVFPRILHRPDCYFAEREAQILLSPASVDLGGVFITPKRRRL